MTKRKLINVMRNYDLYQKNETTVSDNILNTLSGEKMEQVS